MKKTAIILLTALLLSSFASCSAGKSSSDTVASGDTSAPGETTAAETTTEDESAKLGLPESNYNGQTFRILVPNIANYEYIADEETGEVVNDAVFARNRKVEDLLNVELSFNVQPGNWEDQSTWNNLISSSVMAGDNAIDLVSAVTVVTMPIAGEGCFVNVYDINYINLDNPWWLTSEQKDLTIQGKLFGFIGDASLSMYKSMAVILFNSSLIENYGLDDPYELVKSNGWTADKMIEMSKDISGDINGDGAIDKNDLFGLIDRGVPLIAFQSGFDIKVLDIGEDGNPYVVGITDRLTAAADKCYEYFQSDATHTEANSTDLAVIFSADRALFYADTVEVTEILRDMESDFGIIPYPKLDETQEKYNTQLGTATSMFFVPITTSDLDLTGMVCESMAYYSYLGVTPAYFEVALKEKYTRDDNAKEMLDIIRDGAVMDITFAYSTCFPGWDWPNLVLNTVISKGGKNNVASYIDRNQTSWTKVLEQLKETYAAL